VQSSGASRRLLVRGAAVIITLVAMALAWGGCDNGNDPSREALAGQASAGACKRPYASSSPWNRPISAKASYDPRSKAHAAALGGPLSSDPTQYTYPVYNASSATVPVTITGNYSRVTARGKRLRFLRRARVRVPLPASAQSAAGYDSQLIVVDRRSGAEWGFFRLRKEGGVWVAENGYEYNTRWSGVPPAGFGSRGAGVTYLAGLVRPCEIRRGRIDHAIAFAYDYPTARFVPPATKSDGASTSPDDVPEGSRLQLDPTLTTAALRARGCNRACLIIARALQRYGMYVIDNSGRPKLYMEYERTARWRGTVDEDTVSPIPLSAFRLVRSG